MNDRLELDVDLGFWALLLIRISEGI
jgi:hypothetical protein